MNRNFLLKLFFTISFVLNFHTGIVLKDIIYFPPGLEAFFEKHFLSPPESSVDQRLISTHTFFVGGFKNYAKNRSLIFPPNISFKTHAKIEKMSSFESYSTDYFRSKNSGDWNNLNSWESSHDNITWEDATQYPTFEAAGILIRNSHLITLTAHSTAKLLIIEAGGTLTNNGPGGGFTLTISDDGTSEPDFKIYGTYILFGTQPIFNTNAIARVYGNGLVRADDNIGSAQSDNFASNNNVTFNTQAVFEWNINKPFKTSGITYFPNSGIEIPVFRVSKDPGSVGTGVLTINGVLDVNADFTFIGGSNKIFRNGIVGNRTLTQNNTTNNKFTINGDNAILGGSSLRIHLSNPMFLESSVTVPQDSIVIISGANLNNNTTGNNFLIQGVLDVTTISITNTEGKIITVGETGIYRTAHAGGFSGVGSSIPSLIGTVVLQPGSTIELYHSGNQFLRVRPDFSNVIFSGSGTKTVSSAFTPNGTITIKDNAILDGGVHIIGGENTNLTMLGNSRLILNTVGRSPGADGIYKLEGGVIQFNNHSGTKQTIRGTTSQPDAGNSVVYNQIEVTGSNVGIGNGNINLKEGGKFTLKSGGVFEVNSQSIKALSGSANQKVIIEPGAEFKTGSEHGFHGIENTVIPIGVSSIHPNITDITLLPNSTVNYHRSNPMHVSGAQTITATIPYHHLIISGNQEKTAQENGIIEIKGNLSKTTNAVFKHNNSTVIFNGPAAQTYRSVYPHMIFNNLTNENIIGLNIQDSLSILRELNLGNNSKLNINADITLQSNLENTANVAPIPANASINYSTHNRFIVERHIPNHRKAWQLISTPVHGNQTIHQSWQEGMARGMDATNNAPGAPGNLKPGYGTTITSERPTWEADGFDKFTGPGPSLKTYNHLTNKWEGVSSTNNPVQSKEGYLLMVRGDRSVIAHDQPATATTLRTRGMIYAPGTLIPPATAVPYIPGTFVSVGNPYASAINYYSTTRENLSDSYIIWDPQLTSNEYSQYGLGAYRTISNGVAVPSSGNYTDENIPPIQSGQAFFVQLALGATAAGSISFTENAKTSGSRVHFRGGNTFTSPEAHLRVNLHLLNNGNSILLDGNLHQFHTEYSPALDQLDVIKKMNSGENLGIVSHSKTLAIERKPLFGEMDTIFYSISGLKRQQYEMEFLSHKTDISGLESYLEDEYLNKQTLLNPSGITKIGFEVNNDAGSYDRNRFRIIFKSAKGPLPVTITQFTVQAQNKEVRVKWISENESGIEKYVVERSASGVDFNPLTEVIARNGAIKQYQIQDNAPLAGNNYYRLHIIHNNGKTTYSDIVKVAINPAPSLFSLYPNPVINGRINVHFSNQEPGMYSMRLLNVTGQSITSKNIYYNGQTIVEAFNIESKPEGFYYLEIMNAKGERSLLKVSR